ncbi:TLD domain-containing protein 2 [Eurytemora carolleeae]|uniref:TLD domain-containing protein 2 n=1 Tax=Eurytemora carolleeae TaxID=1294199 RepID=UPI000C792F9F|nr:TLD domain-containing protein 2 [Eurytemora carolleeae]XP_023333960.1 TLD domain-containing protein 2 [Eurytemora carolleeae]|eukprot:XP_023333959.1 TLD domain-containing protein 2-like [Eurytemora affinis]
MSSWIPNIHIPGILKRSHSDAVMLTSRPSIQQKASLDLDCIPEVEGESEVLLLDEIKYLSGSLPPRILGADWRLVYSTSSKGFSLGNVYRSFQGKTGPTLVSIQDTAGAAFGALISEPIKMDEHFYGTGESFLFSVRPNRKIYKWTGENQLFVQGTSQSLIIGAGEGHFGLFIDSNLYKGRTQACATYGNEPLRTGEDFLIKTFECWTFR